MKRIVADVVVEYARLVELLEVMEAAEASGAHRPRDQAREGLTGTSQRLRACLEELDDVGVQLVDWSAGLVVFLSAASGREVWLSWQHGEPEVLYWQDVDLPDAGRRPIETLLAEIAPAD